MEWVKPVGTLGDSTVAAGTPIKYSIAGGNLGYFVVATIPKAVHQNKIEKNASAPPDTSSWSDGTLKKDTPFEIRKEARGTIDAELENGLVSVNFSYVSQVLGEDDINTQ